MEANTAFSRRKPSSSDRFFTFFSQSPPSTAAPSPVVTGATSAGDELSEDDVFWNGESAESSSSPSTSSTPPAHLNRRSASKSFGRAENFGILAALPGIEHERNNSRSILNQKASTVMSSSSASALSSSSSARMIPVIPRPPPERTFSASLKYHQYQSAPVNVPMMMRNDFGRLRKGSVLEENDDLEEDDEEGEMLPPHEIVSKQSVKSPILSCSVLEGAGRTLKGRDLRQVRNAVFQQTGFLD